MIDVLLITGMSGAGRTQAGNTLEDLGWFVIDNLPVELVPKVGELAQFRDAAVPIALVVGTGSDLGRVVEAVDSLRESGVRVSTLFLDASTSTLVRRYGDTKRRHPLLELTGSVESAIEAERNLLAGARAMADYVVDTSEMNIHDLRRDMTDRFAERGGGATMQVTVMSFGYKHGAPADADLVFDCRFLPNPHWEEELRDLRGTDEAVQAYVMGSELAPGFTSRVEDLLDYLLPAYVAEGKSVLTIAFGCTGGHHRSVTMAEHFAAWLGAHGMQPHLRHRDIDR
jgi:UPF0042 nucleotide-binding protein